MKKFDKKISVESLFLPVDNYKYIIKELFTVDGENYYYTGHSTYAKTKEEALKIAKTKEEALKIAKTKEEELTK